jgi:hypothetical protein
VLPQTGHQHTALKECSGLQATLVGDRKTE